MIYAALLLLILGLTLLWMARRRQKASGLPGGRIIYSDTRSWGPVEKPLYDPELGLTGKPDYLVKQGRQLIPVEVKSSRAAEAPYDSHIFQLAVYCRLVQVSYGVRPAYGILHYSNRTYAIDYTTALEDEMLKSLKEIRNLEGQREVQRSHESRSRCLGCGYRAVCSQNLGRATAPEA